MFSDFLELTLCKGIKVPQTIYEYDFGIESGREHLDNLVHEISYKDFHQYKL